MILVPVRHNLVISSDPKGNQNISSDPQVAAITSNTAPVPIPTPVPVPIPVSTPIPVSSHVPALAPGPPPLKHCLQGPSQGGQNQVPSYASHKTLNTSRVKSLEDSQKSPEEMTSDKLILVQEDGNLSYVELVTDEVADAHQRKRKSSGQLGEMTRGEMTSSKRIRKQTCVVSLVEEDGHVTDAKLVNYDFFKTAPLQKKKSHANKVDETNLQGKKPPHAMNVDLSNYVLMLPQDGKASGVNLTYKAGYEVGIAVAPTRPSVSPDKHVAQVQVTGDKDIWTNNGSNNQFGNSKEMLPVITEVVSLNPEFRKKSEKLSNY